MSFVHKIGYVMAKNAPTILYVSGKVFELAGLGWACYSSTKIKDDIRAAKEELKEARFPEDKRKVKAKFAWTITKRFGPPMILLGAGAVCDLAAFGKLKKRAAGYAAAAASGAAALAEARQAVTDKYGEDAALEIFDHVATKKITTEETDIDGSVKEKAIDAPVALITGNNSYVYVFDKAHSIYASGDVRIDMAFLEVREGWLNDRLRANHRLTEAEWLEELGFAPELPANADIDWEEALIRGWTYFKEGTIGDGVVNNRTHVVWIDDPDGGKPYQAPLLNPNMEADIYHPYKKKKNKLKE